MAIARDVSNGAAMARLFAALMLVTGAAPVDRPVLGGQLLLVTSWRGIFGLLAVAGVLLLLDRGVPGAGDAAGRAAPGGRLRRDAVDLPSPGARPRLPDAAARDGAGVRGTVRLPRRLAVPAAGRARALGPGVQRGVRGQHHRPDGAQPAQRADRAPHGPAGAAAGRDVDLRASAGWACWPPRWSAPGCWRSCPRCSWWSPGWASSSPTRPRWRWPTTATRRVRRPRCSGPASSWPARWPRRWSGSVRTPRSRWPW